MNKQTEALNMAIEVLKNNKKTHYYCQDTFYSCPKHEDGCANDFASTECDCGADETNAEFDKTIQACKEALAQPSLAVQSAMDEMWDALASYQSTANVAGHGLTWMAMCLQKTSDATADAVNAADVADAYATLNTAYAACVAYDATAYAIRWANKATTQINELKGKES